MSVKVSYRGFFCRGGGEKNLEKVKVFVVLFDLVVVVGLGGSKSDPRALS